MTETESEPAMSRPPAAARERFDALGFSEPHYDRWIALWSRYYDHWLRVEVEGLDNIPDVGSALLVGNHAGYPTVDAMMLQVAVRRHHHAHRAVRPLVHVGIQKQPAMGYLLCQCGGGVVGHPRNADYLVEKGELMLIYPEGSHASAKTFRERHQLRPVEQFSRGFVNVALKHDVPVIPVATIGCETAIPTLGHSRMLGKWFGMDDGLFPLSPQTLLMLPAPMWGLFLPFPIKCRIRVGPPLNMKELVRNTGSTTDAGREVRRLIQAEVDELLKRRRRE